MGSYRTVAVDFDGVISRYDGWKGPGVFGGPIEGCREELEKLKEEGWTVIIFTTRGVDIDLVRNYLVKHKIPFDHINENRPDAPKNISDKKVIADCYIDDRAINFDGCWEGMAKKVLEFKPYYQTSCHFRPKSLTMAGCLAYRMSFYSNNSDTSAWSYCILTSVVDLQWKRREFEIFDYTKGKTRTYKLKTLQSQKVIGNFDVELIELTSGWELPPHLLHYMDKSGSDLMSGGLGSMDFLINKNSSVKDICDCFPEEKRVGHIIARREDGKDETWLYFDTLNLFGFYSRFIKEPD